MSQMARSADSVATADKNDVAELLSLGEIGIPRKSHDSGAKMIHSKLLTAVRLVAFTRRCSVDRVGTAADAG